MTPKRIVRPMLLSERIAGGAVSFTQKRNVYLPGFAPAGVSKTKSYAPGAGRTAPTTGTTRPKPAYGFRSTGMPV